MIRVNTAMIVMMIQIMMIMISSIDITKNIQILNL